MLLHEPRVLVLDEATSTLDSESERKIQAALAEVVSGHTTIAVAHRLSTIQSADVIPSSTADHRRVRRHEQLLTAGAVYRALYDEHFGAGDVECECADGVVWADGRFGPVAVPTMSRPARSIRTRHRRQPMPTDTAGERCPAAGVLLSLVGEWPCSASLATTCPRGVGWSSGLGRRGGRARCRLR